MNTKMKEVLKELSKAKSKNFPDFKSGDTVKVFFKIKEGDKERVQMFKGTVIQKKGSGQSATVTVRKISFGVGVERIFPLTSPRLTKIEVTSSAHTRRARIYYLRKAKGKAARVKGDKVDLLTEEIPTNLDQNQPAQAELTVES